MTLRLRLLLAFGYLFTLVLVTAASATFGFLHLASGIDQVLTENFRTIRATMRMSAALGELDRSALAARLPDGPLPRTEAARRDEFLAALAEAEANVTETEEPDSLQALRDRFQAYARARDVYLAAAPEARGAIYERDLVPLRRQTEEAVAALLAINERAMFREEAVAKRTAVRSAAVLGALVALSLLSFVFMSNALHRDILDRLDELRTGVSLLGSGDRVRRLREDGDDDELAVIVREINRLLDREQEAESRAQGRLARERRVTLGLLARYGAGAALFSRDGYLLAGALVDASLHETVGNLVAALDGALEPRVLEPGSGVRLRAEPLGERPGTPAAWLVTTDPPAS